MDKQDHFYIGWQEKMPAPHRRFLRPFLFGLVLLLPILVFTTVWFQKDFNDHRFELGTLTEVTGTYYESPVPLLLADEGELSNTLSKSILLVGFGKFGAEGIMKDIQETEGSLVGKKVRLSGTLIYGAGHTVMELTQKEASLVQVYEDAALKTPALTINGAYQGKGEILDPKCYFGVMKPGEGKTHKSCAIRCLSGGIPAVFKPDNTGDYYILLDAQGKKLNEQLLPYIGYLVDMNGSVSNYFDWKVMVVDSRALSLNVSRKGERCGGDG